MKQVKYSIGTDPMNRKNFSLYLWRDNGKELMKMAKFSSHTHAEMFAKEFDFPLSDSVLNILSNAQVTGQSIEVTSQ